MKSKWLFIHGGWGGSWQWTPLQDKLDQRGLPSYAPDMPGMGENRGNDINLHNFVTHCHDLIKEEKESINVAAFSFGGMTATALAGRFPEKINKLVYVDAFVPKSGQAFSHIAGEKITRQIKAYCSVMGENDMIPPFFETDSRYRSHPLNTLFTQVDYRESDIEELNPLYIECTAKDPDWTFTPLLEKTAKTVKKRGWKVTCLHSDHMPMYSHTEELLELLIQE